MGIFKSGLRALEVVSAIVVAAAALVVILVAILFTEIKHFIGGLF